jgi:hypothetical protein
MEADGESTRAPEYARAFLDRGPGRHHIVDDHHVLAGDTATGPHRKGSADVAFARRRPEVPLHRGPPPPNQPVRRDLGPARSMHRPGEQRRLVIAALEEPGPMQRHRDEQIGAGEYISAGTLHPLPERCS